MPIFEYENYDDDEIFDFEESEFGDVRKVIKPAAKKPAKVMKVIRKQPQSFFSQQVQKLGQSRNIEDRRTGIYEGNHLFQVWGYLTRSTWFHLASQVKYDILNALKAHGFGVFYVAAWDRDKANSQYNFEIHLRVLDGFSTNEVKNSLVNTLAQTIALPNSIRIKKVIDYQE
jgi:hypothetical protein